MLDFWQCLRLSTHHAKELSSTFIDTLEADVMVDILPATDVLKCDMLGSPIRAKLRESYSSVGMLELARASNWNVELLQIAFEKLVHDGSDLIMDDEDFTDFPPLLLSVIIARTYCLNYDNCLGFLCSRDGEGREELEAIAQQLREADESSNA
jgi:hypothetical protein